MGDEIVKAETVEVQNYTPMNLIAQAIEKGLSISDLKELFELEREYKKDAAKKAFDEAMAKFQSKCPIIKKRKNGGKTDAGFVAYKYAPIEDIVLQTKDLISECGFSYLIKAPSFTDKDVTVSCEVRHVAGHSETSTVTMPLITKNKLISDTQVVGGTNTFAKRYAFCNAFGIMTMDTDNDAQAPAEKKEPIPEPKRNWKPQIGKCETLDALSKIYDQMTDEERKDNRTLMSEIKKNIQTASKKQ